MNDRNSEENSTIGTPPFVSISEARRRLVAEYGPFDVSYLKGFAEGMGIRLGIAPPSYMISEADFRRLESRLKKIEPAHINVGPKPTERVKNRRMVAK